MSCIEEEHNNTSSNCAIKFGKELLLSYVWQGTNVTLSYTHGVATANTRMKRVGSD